MSIRSPSPSIRRRAFLLFFLGSLALSRLALPDGVWVRFRLDEPKDTRYHVVIGGYIHNAPWYLPRAVVPEGADRDPAKRAPSGRFTPWFDLGAHAGKLLHGRLQRSGGVAEFPNVTADFAVEASDDARKILIELAVEPNERSMAKRFEETFRGSLTSFLVSPELIRDAPHLECASEMTRRRLSWAREASRGQRRSPKKLIVQTSFWSPQRAELNLEEAKVLHLLGFNVVGNQPREVIDAFDFQVPGHTHDVQLGPGATREQIDALLKRRASRDRRRYADGVPYGFSDEVCARPPIGRSEAALTHFRRWLDQQGIPPAELGASRIEEVVPIETPVEFRKRKGIDERAARRIFYYTSRFRQLAAVERLRWHTESFHRHFGPGARTSTLVADHPYFSGAGLGMGMEENWTWGGYPLAIDWFALARARAVDLIGIEDWMGLQYMYGPASTWEGFQLMGFQAAIFHSAGVGELPIIAWITPSDETNLRLKSSSAMCQGARSFFYWTYGPTATSTENYWSDLRGAYDGIVAVTRQLEAAEPILEPGRLRSTRLALLYSISSDLWQPFGYVHMLERRGTYLSLIHDQHRVDFVTEEDIEAGRLAPYAVLYATDPCISRRSAEAIADWVRGGGRLYASCAAGSLDEFGEPSAALAAVYGIDSSIQVAAQPGRYSVRAGVNGIPYTDRIRLVGERSLEGKLDLGVIGAKVSFVPAGARTIGTFSDGSPAVVSHAAGEGRAFYIGACPGIAYIKDAGFVPRELAEKWPERLRAFINREAREGGVAPPVELSHPVVEAGVYDARGGTALVLANFLYEPIRDLRVRLPVRGRLRSVRSVERGKLEFKIAERPRGGESPFIAAFSLHLGLSDIVLLEPLDAESGSSRER